VIPLTIHLRPRQMCPRSRQQSGPVRCLPKDQHLFRRKTHLVARLSYLAPCPPKNQHLAQRTILLLSQLRSQVTAQPCTPRTIQLLCPRENQRTCPRTLLPSSQLWGRRMLILLLRPLLSHPRTPRHTPRRIRLPMSQPHIPPSCPRKSRALRPQMSQPKSPRLRRPINLRLAPPTSPRGCRRRSPLYLQLMYPL